MPRDTLIQHEEPQTRQTAKLIHISDISHIDSEEGIGGIDVARRDFFFFLPLLVASAIPGGRRSAVQHEGEERRRKKAGRRWEGKKSRRG